MGEITLVRHGQANSAATNEADYDRLSDLGHQQARWLGEWMAAHEASFDHVICGTMRRHRETASGMGFETRDEDARLNELAYYELTSALQEHQGTAGPTDPEDFADHMPRVFAAWAAEEIMGTETYHSFETRVGEMLAEAATPGRRILCVTSGGVIGMMLRHLLDLDILRMTQVMLPIYNTSLHRITVMPQRTILSGYNATPHLDPQDRAEARTFY